MRIHIVVYSLNRMLIKQTNKKRPKWTRIQTAMWMNFKTILYERSQDPKDYTLYDSIYMKAKLIYGDRNQNNDCLWGCRLNRRRHKGTFWSDKYVLYLACGAGFMDVQIYQN